MQFDNRGTPETWVDEYSVFLVDPAGGDDRDIAHGEFNVPIGQEIQTPVVVEFPDGFQGLLGLHVLAEHGGSILAWLQVGEKDADTPPTPIKVRSHYPYIN